VTSLKTWKALKSLQVFYLWARLGFGKQSGSSALNACVAITAGMRIESRRKLDRIIWGQRLRQLAVPLSVALAVAGAAIVMWRWPNSLRYFAFAVVGYVSLNIVVPAVCWFFGIGDWRAMSRHLGGAHIFRLRRSIGRPAIELRLDAPPKGTIGHSPEPRV
jgi:hypothetical protein